MSDPLEVEQPGLRDYARIPRDPDPAGTEPSGLREYALLLWREAGHHPGGRRHLRRRHPGLLRPDQAHLRGIGVGPAGAADLADARGGQLPRRASPRSRTCPTALRSLRARRSPQLVAKTLPGAPSVTATQVGTTDVVQVSVRSKDPQAGRGGSQRLRQRLHPLRAEADDRTPSRSAQSQVQNKIDTLQLAIANLNAQIRSAPATTNVTPDETQLGDLQGQLTTLQNQLQNYQFYASQGVTTEAGSGHLDGDRARQAGLAQDASSGRCWR